MKYLSAALAISAIALAGCAETPTPKAPPVQTVAAAKAKHLCYQENVTGSLVQRQMVCEADDDTSQRNALSDTMGRATSGGVSTLGGGIGRGF